MSGQELRETHTAWLEQREGGQRDAEGARVGGGEVAEDALVAEIAAEVETPTTLVPRDLPNTGTNTGVPSSILQDDVRFSSETFVNIQVTAIPSPALSVSTVSDLTPTEVGEESEYIVERAANRHDTFYFEDGNVEIVCEDTMFRVHATIISFSSPKLRDALSPTTLLNAPMPEGCPRIALADSADDFVVLLRVIYTPGYVPHPLDVRPAS